MVVALLELETGSALPKEAMEPRSAASRIICAKWADKGSQPMRKKLRSHQLGASYRNAYRGPIAIANGFKSMARACHGPRARAAQVQATMT